MMREALAVYARVLRSHRMHLPPPLRELGDGYARDEFRRLRTKHVKGEVDKQRWSEFLKQWHAYCDALSNDPASSASSEANSSSPLEGLVDQSGNLRDDVVSLLSDDQRERLSKLRDELRSFDEDNGGQPNDAT
jgi:hypothetical protein